MEKKNKNDYKVVIKDLNFNPFSIIKSAFALIGIIPLLVLFYLVIKENLLHRLFSGHNALTVSTAILVSLAGFLYAYNLINKLVVKLLKYAKERKVSDSQKTEVLLAVTHDFKNPLSTINLAMRNLMDGIGGELSDIHTSIVKSCLLTVDKLHKLIEEILNFSKDGFSGNSLKREVVDFHLLVNNEINSAMPLAKENNLDLRYRLATGNVKLWGDKNKLSRVVMNLVSNALKYTPKDGVIEVRLSADDNAIELSVINSGPGITPEERGRIFNKFERLDRHSGIEGTGLGLSIVKDIVDAHNGRVTVESQPNQNTEFKVILPKDLRSKPRS